MTDLQNDIAQWLHTQQDWLQDAAERLLEKGPLNDEAISQLVERLKSSDGQKVTKHRSFKSLASAPSFTNELKLCSIGNIQGIENLSPRKPLVFGLGNLTVIYGHNGSGKSSYTRILKKVCGKPRAMDLKSNVFQKSPANRQCDITYSTFGIPQTVTWTANSAALAELEPVDIFDGDAAGFYLSGESEVSYIPPAVGFFEELARTCDRIKALLQDEGKRLVSKLPTLPADYTATPAGQNYQALKPGQSETSLKPILEWNTDDETILRELSERLSIEDPAALAKKKRSKKQQVDAIAGALQAAASQVGTQACQSLRELNIAAKIRRRRAEEAAQVNTASAKLKGIGTDTWITLWNAAKDYSVERAYPKQTFPVTEDDARCVLCHQTLDSDAKQRLRDFEAYVQGKVEADAKIAEKSYRAAVEALPKEPSEDEIRTQCQAAGLEEVWLERLKHFWKDVQGRCVGIKSAEIVVEGASAEVPTKLVDELNKISQALEEQAKQHEADGGGFDRPKALTQKLQLEAKHWCSQQSTAIRDEVARLEEIRRFDKWKKLTNTKKISLKAGDISENVITDAYVARFNGQLKALGAQRIKVELVKTRIERGKVKHRILLQGVTATHGTPDSVLSDGERRVVALAAFLADVAGKPHPAPFVFDDPISSLDHDFEWEVAMRLSGLAQDRQVLVFTHRLSLYGAMEEAAKKCGEDWKKQHLQQACIETFSGTAGHPVDEAAWNANTKRANNILISRLDEAKKYWDSGDINNYKIHAQGICTDFRKLLERTVEEDLLNKIVKRHRRSITTDNRIAHLSKITKNDCRFIDELMTQFSCYEHSQSHETPTFIPEESELRQHLEALKDWREKFIKRPAEVPP